MEIIPAIDLIGGKCVRLVQGDYEQKKEYSDDPVAMARRFEDAGLKRLHVVDLDGAKAKELVNLKVVEAICKATSLHVDFGGGIRTAEDVERVLAVGVQQVTAGSIAAKEPETVYQWLERFGSEKIILGADVKNLRIAVSGWQEESAYDLFDFLEMYRNKGAQHVICTDVSKDGMLAGPAFEVYRIMLERFPLLRVIASGGVSRLDDLHKLEQMGVAGVIVGKAIYEGPIALEELTPFVA